MASLGNALVTKILGHSAAEKAFRPWWDNLEDFLCYGLVMLGLIVAPTAIINGTPLDCNFCRANECDDVNYTVRDRGSLREEQVDPGYNAWWVKKYCTMHAVDGFIMYFPYILLIMALVIVLIERVFVRIFKSGLNLDMFYNLLAKESLEAGNGTTTTCKVEDGGAGDDKRVNVSAIDDLQNNKTALEVSHTFSRSSSYFMSYLLRTLAELIVAVALMAWLLLSGVPSIQNDKVILCNVHGHLYECAGHPQEFYMYILFVTVAILLVYILCCLYNVLWIAFRDMSALGRIMGHYKTEMRKRAKDQIVSDRELLGELYNVYYNNRDLRLLLDLLAESSGIAPSIRIMSLFDPEFRTKSEVVELCVSRKDGDENTVVVQFSDPPNVRNIFSSIRYVTCIYTVEIIPGTPKSSVAVFEYGRDEYEVDSGVVVQVNEAGDNEMRPLRRSGHDGRLKRTEFRELDPGREYLIRVCTVMNGRAIARKVDVVKPIHTYEVVDGRVCRVPSPSE